MERVFLSTRYIFFKTQWNSKIVFSSWSENITGCIWKLTFRVQDFLRILLQNFYRLLFHNKFCWNNISLPFLAHKPVIFSGGYSIRNLTSEQTPFTHCLSEIIWTIWYKMRPEVNFQTRVFLKFYKICKN